MKGCSPWYQWLSLWLVIGVGGVACPEVRENEGEDQPVDAGTDPTRDIQRDAVGSDDDAPIDVTPDPGLDLPLDSTVDTARDPARDDPVDLAGDPPVDTTSDPAVDPVSDPTTDPLVDPSVDPVVDPVVDADADALADPDAITDPLPDTAIDPQPDGAATCPNQNLGSALGTALASGTTVGRGNDNLSAICVSSATGSEDVTLAWTAPRAGNFRFDTLGSEFDTVLYLLDGGCAGTELTCNDDEDDGYSLQSSLTVPLAASQQVIIVVDGYGGAAGQFVLNIQELTGCAADIALGTGYGSPIAYGSLAGNADDSVGSCGSDLGGEDVSFTWTAPATARFRFTTEGSNFDTVLYLYGSDCVTEEGCNDDDWNPGTQSSVELDLTIGEQVVVIVDGYTATSTGTYQLNIYNVSSPELVCNDWSDDDADGFTDCADPTDCQGTATCTPGPGPSGSACTTHSNCSAVGSDPSCFIQDMGWPSGYCAEYCDPDASDCPQGSICVLFVGDVGYCMDRCDGTYGSCRADTMPDDWNPGATISYACDAFGIWSDGTMVCGPSWWLE